MSFKCKIGLHSWSGCICVNCEKTRHDLDKKICIKCGKSYLALSLMEAIIIGDNLSSVKISLETLRKSGIDVNEKNERGETLLQIASKLNKTNSKQIVKLLISMGAGTRKADNNVKTSNTIDNKHIHTIENNICLKCGRLIFEDLEQYFSYKYQIFDFKQIFNSLIDLNVSGRSNLQNEVQKCNEGIGEVDGQSDFLEKRRKYLTVEVIESRTVCDITNIFPVS